MRLRSLLFVPGDRPERMEKALALDADAIILDLEDSVVPQAKPAARAAIASFLYGARRRQKLLVRVNALGSPFIEDDLAAISECGPDALVLPKAEGATSVEALARRTGGLPVLPIATETPAAIFQLGTYAQAGHLLFGLTWGAEDLPAAIGASTARRDDGNFTPPYELARSLTLFAGHAAGVPVIETVYPDFKDREGLSRYALRARRDGFNGMLAVHPSQLSVINKAFTPDSDEVRRAKEIIQAFVLNPCHGALQIDGRMVDAPHLVQARRIIALAKDSD